VIAAVIVAGSPGSSPAADLYLREELRIPDAAAGPRGLEALLVRPSEAGRYPLVLINHGSPRSPSDRQSMSPWSLLPEAIEFARRGWAAAVVMRRSYGDSDGKWAEAFNGCADSNYIAAGEAAAADLKTATSFLQQRPDIDAKRIIAVGVSAGGFATVALTADPPGGLVAAISFAGGRGSLRDNEVCRADRLLDAFAAFGKRSRVPMLWVYAENDHFFGPKLAEQFKDAFVSGGGNVEFIAAPAFGSDGHRLFSPAGIPIWSGYVGAFLQRHGLTLLAQLLPPPPHPPLAVPAVLGPKRPRRLRKLPDKSAAQGLRRIAGRLFRLAIRRAHDGGGRGVGAAILRAKWHKLQRDVRRRRSRSQELEHDRKKPALGFDPGMGTDFPLNHAQLRSGSASPSTSDAALLAAALHHLAAIVAEFVLLTGKAIEDAAAAVFDAGAKFLRIGMTSAAARLAFLGKRRRTACDNDDGDQGDVTCHFVHFHLLFVQRGASPSPPICAVFVSRLRPAPALQKFNTARGHRAPRKRPLWLFVGQGRARRRGRALERADRRCRRALGALAHECEPAASEQRQHQRAVNRASK